MLDDLYSVLHNSNNINLVSIGAKSLRRLNVWRCNVKLITSLDDQSATTNHSFPLNRNPAENHDTRQQTILRTNTEGDFQMSDTANQIVSTLNHIRQD